MRRVPKHAVLSPICWAIVASTLLWYGPRSAEPDEAARWESTARRSVLLWYGAVTEELGDMPDATVVRMLCRGLSDESPDEVPWWQAFTAVFRLDSQVERGSVVRLSLGTGVGARSLVLAVVSARMVAAQPNARGLAPFRRLLAAMAHDVAVARELAKALRQWDMENGGNFSVSEAVKEIERRGVESGTVDTDELVFVVHENPNGSPGAVLGVELLSLKDLQELGVAPSHWSRPFLSCSVDTQTGRVSNLQRRGSYFLRVGLWLRRVLSADLDLRQTPRSPRPSSIMGTSRW